MSELTLDELIALPQTGPSIRYTKEVVDGITRRIPHMTKGRVMTMKPDDVMLFTDHDGNDWQTGWIDGVLFKRKHWSV